MEEVKTCQFCGWSGTSLAAMFQMKTNESLVRGRTLPMMSVSTRSGYRMNGRGGNKHTRNKKKTGRRSQR